MATVTFPELHNNGITTLNGAINGSVTTINLATGGAAALGLDNSTTDAYLTIIDATTWRKNPLTSPETLEIVQVTAVSTDTLTVTRGVDGTSGIAFGDGSIVELRQPAITIQRVYDALTDGNDTIAPNIITTQDGTASAPSHSFTDDTDNGMYRIGANNIGFATAGTKALEVDASQNTVFSGAANPVSERGHDMGTASLPWKDIHHETMVMYPSNAGSQPLRYNTMSGEVSGTPQSNFMQIEVADGTVSSQVIVVRYRGHKRADYTGQLQTIGWQGNTAKAHTGVVGTTTIDWGNDGNVQSFTFGAGNETLAFTNPADSTIGGGSNNPAYCMLSITQDATGSRTATWPASVKWPGGTAPTLSTGSGAVDLIVFMFTGSSYLGFSYLNYS